MEVKGVSQQSNLTHPDLRVWRTGGLTKERTLHVISGTTVGRELIVNNPDIGTLECALLERMYYCKRPEGFVPALTPDRNVLQCRLHAFRKALLAVVGHSTPRTTTEVVGMYRGRKATIYGNAEQSLNETGLRREHAYSIAFTKAEKVKRNKAPRCIQPRKPQYNLSLGCYLKHIEHRMYKGINKVFRKAFGTKGPTVVSGYNVNQIGEIFNSAWAQFADPVAIGLDAEKFDMHVHEFMLLWEHSIYLAMYHGDATLAKLLSWQVNNKGFGYCADGKLKYSVRGKRFSGDMNTAMGNKIIMCGMVYAYALEKGRKIRLINNGDDCVVIMERKHLKHWMEGFDAWFATMGFRMTIEQPVYSLEQVEFCQMHPIKTQRGWTMVRNISTAREKDSISINALSTKTAMEKWLGAIGECGMALCAGVPIMQAMYEMYARHGKESRLRFDPAMDTGMSRMRGDLVAEHLDVLPETRAMVFSAWGITPDEQIAIEEAYNNATIEWGNELIELSGVQCSNL